MLWLFVRVCLLDFICSGVRFCLLLSPYICVISLLYFDLYVLGDGALKGLWVLGLSCGMGVCVS